MCLWILSLWYLILLTIWDQNSSSFNPWKKQTRLVKLSKIENQATKIMATSLEITIFVTTTEMTTMAMRTQVLMMKTITMRRAIPTEMKNMMMKMRTQLTISKAIKRSKTKRSRSKMLESNSNSNNSVKLCWVNTKGLKWCPSSRISTRSFKRVLNKLEKIWAISYLSNAKRYSFLMLRLKTKSNNNRIKGQSKVTRILQVPIPINNHRWLCNRKWHSHWSPRRAIKQMWSRLKCQPTLISLSSLKNAD